MKTTRLAWTVGAVLLTVAVALYWWLKPQPAHPPLVVQSAVTPSQASLPTPSKPPPVGSTQPTPNAPVKNEPDINQQRTFMTAFLTPFSFCGKVIDHKGTPVGGATVEWSANNNPDPYGSGTKARTETNADGMFSLTSFGIGLYANVSKDGYDKIPTELRGQRGSSGGFSNAGKLGNTDSPMGTRSDPAVFVLRKKGEAAELIHVSERPVKVPKNGEPVEISLATGDAVPTGQGGLKVECWTEDQKRDAQGNYPWRCRVSVPGGGLVKREGEYDFEAPADGYEAHDDIVPPEERWSAKAERGYFVKMADGHFARVNLRMRTGGEHFIVIESYFNPKPGSRNLEYDPSKQASAR